MDKQKKDTIKRISSEALVIAFIFIALVLIYSTIVLITPLISAVITTTVLAILYYRGHLGETYKQMRDREILKD